jgi:hypothetical protein
MIFLFLHCDFTFLCVFLRSSSIEMESQPYKISSYWKHISKFEEQSEQKDAIFPYECIYRAKPHTFSLLIASGFRIENK